MGVPPPSLEAKAVSVPSRYTVVVVKLSISAIDIDGVREKNELTRPTPTSNSRSTMKSARAVGAQRLAPTIPAAPAASHRLRLLIARIDPPNRREPKLRSS